MDKKTIMLPGEWIRIPDEVGSCPMCGGWLWARVTVWHKLSGQPKAVMVHCINDVPEPMRSELYKGKLFCVLERVRKTRVFALIQVAIVHWVAQMYVIYVAGDPPVHPNAGCV